MHVLVKVLVKVFAAHAWLESWSAVIVHTYDSTSFTVIGATFI